MGRILSNANDPRDAQCDDEFKDVQTEQNLWGNFGLTPPQNIIDMPAGTPEREAWFADWVVTQPKSQGY